MNACAALRIGCILCAGSSLLPGSLSAAEDDPQRPFAFRGAAWLRFPGESGRPSGVDVGDLNGDKIPDGVVSRDGNPPGLTTYLADSPLEFRDGTTVEAPFAGETFLLEVTDDGLLDAVVFKKDFQLASVAVFAGDGSGGFHLLSVFPVGYNEGPGQLLAADLDGDGHRDLIYAGGTSFLARGPQFSAAERLSLGQGDATGVALLDADGDGRLDLLFAHSQSPGLMFLLRQSALGFVQTEAITGGGRGPLWLMAIAGNRAPEILARSPNGFAAYRLEWNQNAWRVQMTPLADSIGPTPTFAIGDLDRDGLPDFLEGSQTGELSIRFGRLENEVLDYGGAPLVSSLPGDLGTWGLRLRDVDGDGIEDVLLNLDFYLLVEGQSRRRDSPKFAEATNRVSGRAFDVDGDGHDDLVLASGETIQVFLGSADGLHPLPSIPLQSRGFQVSFAVGRARPGGPALVVHLGQGSMELLTLDGEGRSAGVTSLDLPISEAMAFGPWNGAGDDHLLLLRTITQGAKALTVFDLSSPLSPVAVFNAFVPDRSSLPRSADLDGDGWTDLIYSTESGVQILRGGPSTPIPLHEAVLTAWDSVLALTAVDLAKDGSIELVASGAAGSNFNTRLFWRESTGGWTSGIISQRETRAIRAVDLDGDGLPEVVTTGSAGSEIFWNRGAVGLELPPQWLQVPMGGAAVDDLRILDVDGDGKLDLLSYRSDGRAAITVSHGKGGRGFPRATDLAALPSNVQIASGDFNGDGVDDFVINAEFGNDSLMLSKPDGSFSSPSALVGDAAGSSQLVAGDFDGDGKADLVAVFWSATNLHFLAGRGDGKFDSPRPLPVPPDFPPGKARTLWTSGPLSRDGRQGIVSTNGSTSVQVFLGGEGLLDRAPAVVTAASMIQAVTIADLDADGAPDLLVAMDDGRGRSRTQAFPGNGDGTFKDPLELLSNESPLNFLRSFIQDLNGDGITDLVFFDDHTSTIGIALGEGNFTFSAVANPAYPHLFPGGVADLDGDGKLEILGWESDSGAFLVLKGNGDGTFEAPRFFSQLNLLFIQDLNHDGLPDLLHLYPTGVAASSLSVVFASRETLLDWPRAYPSPNLERLAVGDFNGDHHPVLAAISQSREEIQLLFSDADRELRAGGAIPLGGFAPPGSALFIATADLDGDGFEDLSILSAGRVSFFRSLGGFAFDEAKILLENAPNREFSFTDLDGDGLTDLLVEGFSVARSLGGGRFESLKAYFANETPGKFAVGDFNRDGILDVAQSMGQRGAVFQLFAGQGGARFDSVQALPSAGPSATGLAIGDFNGDHFLDLAHGVERDSLSRDLVPVRVWYGGPGGAMERGADLLDPIGADDGSRGLIARDLDHDGFDDLLSADPEGYTLVYFGGPDGLQRASQAAAGPRDRGLFLAGNFAGDGEVDLVTGDAASLFLTLGSWRGTRFRRGDADGDGRIDLTDAAVVLEWLFVGRRDPACLDSADFDDDGNINLTDPIGLLGFLFHGSTPPAEPFRACGVDPTLDSLRCESYPECNGARG